MSLHKYLYLFVFRGDIVIAKSPFDPQMNICKRVIGLEGDKICTSSPSDLFKTHTYVSIFIHVLDTVFPQTATVQSVAQK